MKEGLSLEEMAAEITRQSKLKEDYLVDTRSLQMEPYDSQVYLHMFDGKTEPVEPMQVNTIAHRQLGTHLKIPASYYDRMLAEKPELLAANVNPICLTPLRTAGRSGRWKSNTAFWDR